MSQDNKLNPEDFIVEEVNTEDPKATVITRTNVTNQFTLHELDKAKDQVLKLKKEAESTIKVAAAMCTNIETNHEWVKEMTEEKLHHAWLYKENKDQVKQYELKLAEVEEVLAQYNELEKIAHEKIGFVPTDVTTEEDGAEKTESA